jgi:hypothetical protein
MSSGIAHIMLYLLLVAAGEFHPLIFGDFRTTAITV